MDTNELMERIEEINREKAERYQKWTTVFDEHLTLGTWIVDDGSYQDGWTGGKIICGICDKTYTWRDWGRYRSRAGSIMVKHLMNKHGIRAESDKNKTIDRIYGQVYVKEWMDGKDEEAGR